MNNKSFTLIELVVAIVIMVILALTGSITQFRSYDALKLDAAAQKVASDIQYAQRLAMDYSPQVLWCTAANCSVANPEFYSSSVIEFFDKNNATPSRRNSYMVLPPILVAQTCNGLGTPSIPLYVPLTDPFTRSPLEVHLDQEYPGVTIESINLTSSGNRTALNFQGKIGEAKSGYWFCFSSSNAQFYAVQPIRYTSWTIYTTTFYGGTIVLGYKGRTKTLTIWDISGKVSY